MNGEVGTLTWRDCHTCESVRLEEGGCNPLDVLGVELLKIDPDSGRITCKRYTEKGSTYTPKRGKGKDDAD